MEDKQGSAGRRFERQDAAPLPCGARPSWRIPPAAYPREHQRLRLLHFAYRGAHFPRQSVEFHHGNRNGDVSKPHSPSVSFWRGGTASLAYAFGRRTSVAGWCLALLIAVAFGFTLAPASNATQHASSARSCASLGNPRIVGIHVTGVTCAYGRRVLRDKLLHGREILPQRGAPRFRVGSWICSGMSRGYFGCWRSNGRQRADGNLG